MLRSLALLSLVAMPAQAITAAPVGEVEALRRTVTEQQARIDALTARLDALDAKAAIPVPAAAPAVAPVAAAPVLVAAPAKPPAGDNVITKFRGSPEFTTADGWRFKVRGRIQYDASYIENPGNSINTKDLGFTTRIRRARLGVEGDMPGGFTYKAEVDFADTLSRAADVVLIWHGKEVIGASDLELTLGHFEPLDGFEQITSSRYTSFIERAAFNEAFGNIRRLGATATYISPGKELRVSAGVFNDTINADRANDDLLLSSRVTWSPHAGKAQLHFGGNIQYRRYQTNDLVFDYRARPFSNDTNTRFVDTGNLALRDDLIVGGEFVGISGPFHVAAEAQHITAHTLRPGELLENGDASRGLRTNGDPGFFGMHAEVGYFFTGESRAYKDGLWTRTRVRNPVGQGGSGSWSVNLRYDWLDLTDSVGAPGSLAAADFIDGGRQSGYLAALVWQPMDYIRFTMQYTHGVVTGGPFQAQVNPDSLLPLSDRHFNFDVAAMRAAWDF
nr:porin [Polymorphobacter sp.]